MTEAEHQRGVWPVSVVTHAQLLSIAGGGEGAPDDWRGGGGLLMTALCSPGTESHWDDGHWVSQLRAEPENSQF